MSDSQGTTMREFHLGDVLSVTTGILMSPTRMDGVYAILNYMTGDSLFTHQLPRACKQAGPAILAQHPRLASIELDAMTPETVAQTLARLVAEYGEQWPLTPLSEYEPRDPIDELVEMRARPASQD